MLKRLRKALVKSFVGAIALGWVFADSISQLASMFAAPVASWITRREYRDFAQRTEVGTAFSLQGALPYLIRFSALLIVGCLLLRWLYWKPLEEETVTADESPDRT